MTVPDEQGAPSIERVPRATTVASCWTTKILLNLALLAWAAGDAVLRQLDRRTSTVHRTHGQP